MNLQFTVYEIRTCQAFLDIRFDGRSRWLERPSFEYMASAHLPCGGKQVLAAMRFEGIGRYIQAVAVLSGIGGELKSRRC
jgi:hypothetical protein